MSFGKERTNLAAREGCERNCTYEYFEMKSNNGMSNISVRDLVERWRVNRKVKISTGPNRKGNRATFRILPELMRVPNPGISINNFLRFLMQDSISLNFYIASNPDWQQNSQDGINSMTVPIPRTRRASRQCACACDSSDYRRARISAKQTHVTNQSNYNITDSVA